MANRVADVARDETNAPVVGATVSLRRITGDTEIANTTTDAGGFYAFDEETVGYPGPVKVRVTDGSGVSRERTSRSTGKSGTIFLSDLARAFLMMTDGVFAGIEDEYEVSGAGLAMNVSVASGMAFLYGHPYYWPTAQTVAIASNGSGNPRKDLIVIRLNPPGVSNEGLIQLAAVQGTPAASPVAPGVTQDPNSVWELALAEVTVAPGATAISSGNVTDVRTYTSGPLTDLSVTTAKLANLAVTTGKLAANAATAAKISNETNYSTAEIAKVLKADDDTATPLWAAINLGELNDVLTTAPTNGQVLKWNSTTSKWEPGAPGGVDAAGLASVMHAATGKSTPVDADELALVDSAASNGLKKLTWANLKATLKTYFDSLYATLTHTHTLTTPPTGFATKTYAGTNVTSTATDGVEIAGFDMDIPTGGAVVFAQGWGQMNAPASPGSYIRLGVKIGSQATDWGMENQTESGERPATATSTRTYGGGASAQRISLRARVDSGTGSVNAAHINGFGLTTRVPAS